MKLAQAIALAATLVAALPGSPGEAPITDPSALVDRMLAAAGEDAFRALGVLQAEVSEEETTSGGDTSSRRYTAYLHTANMDNLRIELGNSVVLACYRGDGWATTDGQLDTRPQAPRLAAASLRQRLFPLFLPFSLRMDGVVLGEAAAGTFEGEEVYQLAVTFEEMFFASPVMAGTWHLVVRRSDLGLMSAEFLPPPDLRRAETEGVRYRALRHADVDGVRLSAEVLLDGIDLRRAPTGHVRLAKLETKVRGPFEPALFMHPEELERLEQGVPGLDR